MNQLLCGKHITKTYGSKDEQHHVLDDISIELKTGEFTAVMGASGSGKSTLLYALSGMDPVDSGDILFEDANLSALSDNDLSDLRRKKMGFVFQQPTLLKNLNLIDNIILPQMRDHRKQAARLTARARTLMKQVGIEALELRDITQVSGGQLQRAGICRALMNTPRILFADEPTGALNSKASDEIMTLFSMIHQSGTAILLVTHDAKVAARAQRVLFMRDGRIVNELSLSDFHTKDLPQRTENILSEMKRLEI